MQEKKLGGELSRRRFIQQISLATLAVMGGPLQRLTGQGVADLQDDVLWRFAVASDIHYGQPNTSYREMTQTILKQLNKFHNEFPLSFCVFNGDLIHDNSSFLPQLKNELMQLGMDWYVTRGNHDMVDGKMWIDTFGYPLNHSVQQQQATLILADTSNQKGEYLSPNLDWLKQQLDKSAKSKHVFLFLHIPQAPWTNNAVDTPAFFDLVRRYPNVRAVFHGHEHDQDGIRTEAAIPYIFDAHVGGNWGTPYRGFRVVEILKNNNLVSYMMNPTEKIKIDKWKIYT
jgi:Icc protein